MIGTKTDFKYGSIQFFSDYDLGMKKWKIFLRKQQ